MLTVVTIWWNASSSVSEARRRWGDTTAVLVATSPLRPGDALIGVEPASWPVALVPEGALDVLDADTVARRHVSRGEVLTVDDVGNGGGPSGLIPVGWSAVHVPAGGDQRRLVTIGDAVTLIVARRTLASGVVVAVGDESVAVAVPDDRVAAAADGVLNGTATLALTP